MSTWDLCGTEVEGHSLQSWIIIVGVLNVQSVVLYRSKSSPPSIITGRLLSSSVFLSEKDEQRRLPGSVVYSPKRNVHAWNHWSDLDVWSRNPHRHAQVNMPATREPWPMEHVPVLLLRQERPTSPGRQASGRTFCKHFPVAFWALAQTARVFTVEDCHRPTAQTGESFDARWLHCVRIRIPYRLCRLIKKLEIVLLVDLDRFEWAFPTLIVSITLTWSPITGVAIDILLVAWPSSRRQRIPFFFSPLKGIPETRRPCAGKKPAGYNMKRNTAQTCMRSRTKFTFLHQEESTCTAIAGSSTFCDGSKPTRAIETRNYADNF